MAPLQGTSTQMDVDPADSNKARDNEIDKIMMILDIIVNVVGSPLKLKLAADSATKVIDLDLSNELSGVLMTVFTCLRKSANPNKPTSAANYLAYKAKVTGVEISIGTVVTQITEKGIKLDFMVATPIVELMTLFRTSFDEVRNGVTKFQVKSGTKNSTKKTVGASNRAVWEQTLTNYGLNNNHIPLVLGITFPPERRTGLIRSLGPLAQAILLVQEDKYPDKIEAALKNSLQMLPMSSDIARCLREAKNPGSVQGVMGELGDLLLITTARSTQKAYLPLLLIRYMWEARESVPEYVWSFSGTGMMLLYNYVVSQIKIKIKTGAVDDLIHQVVFHACFGTYLDDLGILSKITDRTATWNKRKELNSCFMERATKQSKMFDPVKFVLISKMAQALQTKSLGNVNPVSISRPSFTGFRKRNFTAAFLNYMTTGKMAVNFSSDPLQLQYALKKVKDELFANKEDKK